MNGQTLRNLVKMPCFWIGLALAVSGVLLHGSDALGHAFIPATSPAYKWVSLAATVLGLLAAWLPGVRLASPQAAQDFARSSIPPPPPLPPGVGR